LSLAFWVLSSNARRLRNAKRRARPPTQVGPEPGFPRRLARNVNPQESVGQPVATRGSFVGPKEGYVHPRFLGRGEIAVAHCKRDPESPGSDGASPCAGASAISANLMRGPWMGELAFVPEGQAESSQARSAWVSRHFVPGYSLAVPPGRRHSPRRGFD
jgi:hypothetical protein